ncbi:PD-(D/E)XK motif protein [Deltaproteobacteria bacterium OttesenSCG-928-K17]|nr:PD-(D/E)XK motif protein [Deltaproteobacteria bacterium OttesenSCG-928-K17]
MNDERNPWQDISRPISGIHVRKHDSHKSGDIFWAKDSDNTKMLIISLEGDQRDIYNESSIHIKGIKTDLRPYEETGRQCLVLFLESAINSDIFFDFCCTLTDAVRTAENSGGVVFASFQHIRRWKNFLSGGRKLLTPHQIRGLIGELLFLRQMMQAGYSAGQSLESWIGPDGGNQDFVVEDMAVEIKTILGRERGKVRISSEDQLESIQSRLFLNIFRLIEVDKSAASFSLNSLICELRSHMPLADDEDIFDIKLSSLSYSPLPLYNYPHFKCPEQLVFNVAGNFPRLIRSALPAGVSNVLYDISLESIRSFVCKDEIFRKE